MKVVSITDKELINSMPVRVLEQPIHVIDEMSKVAPAVRILSKAGVIGFDTETRPNFRRVDSHTVALIQLATADECFLFRTCRIGIPDKLKQLLENSSVVKVGLSVHDDLTGISRVCPDFRPRSFIDIQDIAPQYQIADMSLQKIYAILFGYHISKGKQLSNWEAEQLSPSQQQYAAIDAYACGEIYDCLTSGAFIAEQSPYYHEVEPPQTPSGK